MRGLAQILILSAAVCGSLALTREKRADCGSQFGAYSQCIASAAGSIGQVQPSGNPDQIARSGCNIIESIVSCNSKLSSGCFNDEVNKMMKQQMDAMLKNLSQIPGWDNDKCPAVKKYLSGGAAEMFVSIPLITLVLARFFL